MKQPPSLPTSTRSSDCAIACQQHDQFPPDHLINNRSSNFLFKPKLLLNSGPNTVYEPRLQTRTHTGRTASCSTVLQAICNTLKLRKRWRRSICPRANHSAAWKLDAAWHERGDFQANPICHNQPVAIAINARAHVKRTCIKSPSSHPSIPINISIVLKSEFKHTIKYIHTVD